jgi:hypothetical protein
VYHKLDQRDHRTKLSEDRQLLAGADKVIE